MTSAKFIISSIVSMLCGFKVISQHQVKFILRELSNPKHNNIYITGNNWDSANKGFQLKPLDDTHQFIVLNLPPGICEYKFTHGTWLTVEKDLVCDEIENRTLFVRHDTTVNVIVENWKALCSDQGLSTQALLQKLKTEKSIPNQIKLMYALGFDATHKADFVAASQYFKQALLLANQHKLKRDAATIYLGMGRMNVAQNKYKEARQNYLLSLSLCEEINDKKSAETISEEIAGIYADEENYDEALKFYYLNLKGYERFGDSTGIARTLYNIGSINVKYGHYPEALKNFRQALVSLEYLWVLYEEDWIKSYIARCYSSIANIETILGDESAALKTYALALQISKEIKSDWETALTMMAMADIYRRQGMAAITGGHTMLARSKFIEAVKVVENSITIYPLNEAYILLGGIHTHQHNFRRARYYIEEALTRSKKFGLKEGIKQSYRTLAELDSAQGRFRQAYDHHKMYILYRDSLVNDQNKRKAEIYRNSYEFEKKEDEIKLLSTQSNLQSALAQKESQRKNFAYGIMAMILLVTGVGFYRFYRSKKLQAQEALLKERLRISRELHDEVGATLSGISMYSHLSQAQLKSSNTTAVEKSLLIIQQGAGEMVLKLNDIVWLIHPQQDSLEKIIQRIEEYAAEMAAVKNIKVEVKIAPKLLELKLPVESRRNIYLFLKEAVNNAIKYSDATSLELSIIQQNSVFTFSVSDNGKGFEKEAAQNGNGLVNMQRGAHEIGAEFYIQSNADEGTKLTLKMNITQ